MGGVCDHPRCPLDACMEGAYVNPRCGETGKLRFSTEAEALEELARITVRAMQGTRNGRGHWPGDKRHLEVGAFECPKCGGWHLSSRPWGGNISNPIRRKRRAKGGTK